MKKRMVPIVLAVVLAISATACADKTTSSSEVSKTASVSAETVEKTVSIEQLADESTKEEIVITGSIDGDVYRNDFFNINVTIKDGYSFYEGEWTEAVATYTENILEDNDSTLAKVALEQIKSGQNFVDLYLGNPTRFNTLNISIGSVGKGFNQDNAATLAEISNASAKEIFALQGMDVQESEVVTLNFSGTEVPGVRSRSVISTGGVALDVYMYQAYVIRDGYCATITVGTLYEDETEDLIEMISMGEAPKVALTPKTEQKDTKTATVAQDENDPKGLFKDADSVPGKVIYVNNFFGFKVVPEEGYAFMSDTFNSAITEATADFVEGSNSPNAQELADSFRNDESGMVFYMADSSFLSAINTQVSYLGNMITEDDMDYMIDEAIKMMKEAFNVESVKELSVDKSTVSCLGKDRACIRTHSKIDSNGVLVDSYTLTVSMIKDGYLCTFSIGSYVRDACDEMAGMIQLLD